MHILIGSKMKKSMILFICLFLSCDYGGMAPWKKLSFTRRAIVINNTNSQVDVKYLLNCLYLSEGANNEKIPDTLYDTAFTPIIPSSAHCWQYLESDSTQSFDDNYVFTNQNPIPDEIDTLLVMYKGKEYPIIWPLDTNGMVRDYSGSDYIYRHIASGSVIPDTIVLAGDTSGLLYKFQHGTGNGIFYPVLGLEQKP